MRNPPGDFLPLTKGKSSAILRRVIGQRDTALTENEVREVMAAATEEELLEFLSAVMRGQGTEAGGKEISMGDRLKACTGLLKLFENRSPDSEAGDRERALAAAAERIWKSIAPGFAAVLGDVLVHGHVHYDLAGGRGSMKSSFVSLTVVFLLLLEPEAHAMVLRKVANTMRDSVYAQYFWAIEKLGVQPWFDCRLSPMELIFRPTGQKILFRGADDPMKIKSVKVPFGRIAVTHFEEKDQFAGRGEIRTVLQSTMRGGDRFWNFESYNPPVSRDNWANLDSELELPNRLRHRSSYLDAPAEWLGEAFLQEAENLRTADERAYRHEYLGEAVGTGGNVFENLELREITEEELRSFDRIYMGVDWGFAPDPFAFIRLHYDAARERICLLDEICVLRQTNSMTAAAILERGYGDGVITCDSAEPKSVADFRSLGLNARAAVKGPGSVEYGMKWLQGRKIVIDRRRTPEAYREFSRYEFERDRDGNFISGYPDRDNHLIDAVRYALERVYAKYRSRA
ncbi:MAG: PBSX family phage terminase large subunit [Oscillospiraceae bacterium]|nr:PBSX family phage terminase large subunit [Oscillospiraceae bacterium]